MSNANLELVRVACFDNAENLARHLLPGGKRSGRYWQAGSVQGEAGQSLKVVLMGERQATWKDFESGDGGDLISLWQRVYQCSFADALKQIQQFLGLSPITEQLAQHRILPKPRSNTPVNVQASPELLEQFYKLCSKADPTALSKGKHYLYNRGILPHLWDRGVLLLEKERINELIVLMENSSFVAKFFECGLLKKRDTQTVLQWWDDVVLFFCYGIDGLPNYVLGRRLSWSKTDRAGKWINLKGSPTLYGLPSLIAASEQIELDWWPTQAKSELLIVEGPADVLAAHSLGFNAVGMLGKIQSNDLFSAGKAQHLFAPYLSLLQKIKTIFILPDNDGPAKEPENLKQALSLADWFWIRNIKAEVKTLDQVFGNDAIGHKDLADIAKAVLL